MAGGLWERAEADLAVRVRPGLLDPVIWEHSARVAKLVEAIATLPELADRAVDRFALTVAALYHDIGWLLQYQAGQLKVEELLVRPTSQDQRELAVDWVNSRLGDLLPVHSLERTCLAIRFCNDRRTSILESQILAEAENLDEIGAQAIPLLSRKQMAEGRTLARWVETWDRQEEYYYWKTRINEGFRFAAVRRLAEQRLEAMRRFMRDLKASLENEDLTCFMEAGACQV